MKGPKVNTEEDDELLHLNDLTVLISSAQEDPFQDIEKDEEPEDTLLIGPEEWLED